MFKVWLYWKCVLDYSLSMFLAHQSMKCWRWAIGVGQMSGVVLRPACVNNCFVNTLEVTFFAQSSWNFVRMIVLVKGRMGLKLGQLRSKTRSLGQIIVKSCIHSKSHIFSPIFLKLAQNVCLNNILDEVKSDQKVGH